jgi:Fic-DOC domain mobile mystery protein B
LPGETPLDDLSGLKDSSITTRGRLNEVEAENVRKAATRYLLSKPTKRTAPFTLAWARRLHKQMFGDVWTWAGEFRRVNVIPVGVDWQQIEVNVQSLLDNLMQWEQVGAPPPEIAAMLHHKAVSIHPFLNGNGRWARMLANIWLRRHGHRHTVWPDAMNGSESTIRGDYMKALKSADEGDYTALIEQHRQYADVPLDWLPTDASGGSLAPGHRDRPQSQSTTGETTQPVLGPDSPESERGA